MSEAEIRAEKRELKDILDRVFTCPHPEVEMRRHVGKTNNIQLTKQCLVCGRQVGKWLSKKSFSQPDIESLALYDRELYDLWTSKKRSFYFRLAGVIDEKNGGNFWERYYRHMSSPESRQSC